MNAPDPILAHQLQSLRRIIDDETWLEGERRGCPVSRDDRVVRECLPDRAAHRSANAPGGNGAAAGRGVESADPFGTTYVTDL
jgi:hypothetical protein